MVTDSISDMFNQIMNAQAVARPVVWLPYIKMNIALAKILKNSHYLQGVKKRGLGAKARMGLVLQYFDDQPAIDGFKEFLNPDAVFILPLKKLKEERACLFFLLPRV